MCTDCSCGTDDKQAAEPIQLATEAITATYTVEGMTCGHCASSVTDKVSGLDGVVSVDVDVASGSVTVRSATPLDAGAVRGAVDEAGYRLVNA
ncbi:MAG: heavy-metal-associated domain-containing protein [Kribbellaceae bacterium]|nr:heavy-metal-associated domain-containing protein [Catenulispora sp.]NUR99648.1 heavy-metal-associated domain-containing protein [Kribbellaceae bacterium]